MKKNDMESEEEKKMEGQQNCYHGYNKYKKTRIRETKHLSTDADSSTAAKKLLSIFLIPLRRRRRQGALTPKKRGSEGGWTNQRP